METTGASADRVGLEFGRRLTQACDNHPHVPPLYRGRLSWIQAELKNRLQLEVSTETIRRWLDGQIVPRSAKVSKLAELLGLDVAWLSLGVEETLSIKERRVRDATADGAVNLIAGLIQMDGGRPAFPSEDDDKAARDGIDLYAIIRGVNYMLHVTVGERLEDGWKFTFPAVSEGVLVLALVKDGLDFRIFEIADDHIEAYGERRQNSVVLNIGKLDGLREIETFNARL